MIKAGGSNGLGQPLLFLGITGENVTRLAAGEPIRIRASDLAQLGLPAVEVLIHYGRTEGDVLDDLRTHGVHLRTE